MVLSRPVSDVGLRPPTSLPQQFCLFRLQCVDEERVPSMPLVNFFGPTLPHSSHFAARISSSPNAPPRNRCLCVHVTVVDEANEAKDQLSSLAGGGGGLW